MLGALTSLLILAVSARELSDQITTVQIINLRNGISFLIIAVILQIRGWQQIRTTQLTLHFVRNTAHLAAQYAWIVGLASIPIAEVFALEFTGPVWTVIFAALLLGESINRYRIITLIMGFIGALIILRPGFQVIDPAMLFVIFSAMSFSLAHVLTKKLVSGNSALNIIFYMTTIQFLLTLWPTTQVWVLPSPGDWLWILLMGTVSITAHYSFVRAFSLADAMIVIPLDFLRLPLAALVGYLFYQEGLDMFVLLGAIIMFSGNLINIIAEKRKTDLPAQPKPK